MNAVEQEFDGEARRIAAGLVLLHKDGAVASQADAMFYARLLCDFGATYLGTVEAASRRTPDQSPYVPTKQQLVRVSRGFTREGRQRFLQEDLSRIWATSDNLLAATPLR
jgi:hypothetical protein